MYTQQDAWGTLIAAYLFLGGVGGATAAIGLTVDQYVKPNRRMGVAAGLSSLVLLSVGSILLLVDLLQPLNTIYFFGNPHSWIFWGIVFILGMILFDVLYLLPHLEGWPLVGRLARDQRCLQRWQRITAAVGAACGFAVTLYTGFLLSAAPGIPFWNSPLLPVLFTVSAFSTGLGYLMVMMGLSGNVGRVMVWPGQIDAGTILLELIALLAFLAASAFGGRPEAAHSVRYLLGSPAFVVGFLLVGLILPLAIEGYTMAKGRRGEGSAGMVGLGVLSGLLVLVGGFLLRQYVLLAGFYVKVW